MSFPHVLNLSKKRLALAFILRKVLKDIMSDGQKVVANSHSRRINTSEESQLKELSKAIHIPIDRLKGAIKNVGSIAKDIGDFLKKRNKK